MAFQLVATGVFAEVIPGGFLSFEYLKTQSQGASPDGAIGELRLGFSFSGSLSPKMDFFGQTYFVPDGEFEIPQAWVRFRPADYVNLKIGLYLVPFGFYNERSLPHQTGLAAVPLHAAVLYPYLWRDVGLVAEGKVSGIIYSLFIGNGLKESAYPHEGQQYRDNNSDFSWGGRFGLSLEQGFDAAYSLYRGKLDGEKLRALTMHNFAFNWNAESFEVVSEYVKSAMENPEGFDGGDARGWFVRLTVIMKGIHPIVSYQNAKVTDSFRGLGFTDGAIPGEGILLQKSRWSLGGVVLLGQSVFLKFEYDWNREKDLEIRNNAFICQLAVSF